MKWRSLFLRAAKAIFDRLPRLRRSRLHADFQSAVKWLLPHRRAVVDDENEMMNLAPRRSGPMSRYELYCWHRANGTLALFFKDFGR